MPSLTPTAPPRRLPSLSIVVVVERRSAVDHRADRAQRRVHFAIDTWSAHSYVEGSGDLDRCNGRVDANGNYACHTTKTFTYVFGCYHRVVTTQEHTGDGAPNGGPPTGGPPGSGAPARSDRIHATRRRQRLPLRVRETQWSQVQRHIRGGGCRRSPQALLLSRQRLNDGRTRWIGEA
jgi:hypothetical protein